MDDIPEELLLTIFQYLSLREAIHLKKVSKKWRLIIDDKFLCRTIKEHYNFECNSSNIKKAFLWFAYDQKFEEFQYLGLLPNGNMLCSGYKNRTSKIINMIGEDVLLLKHESILATSEIILVEHITNTVHVFDENGHLTQINKTSEIKCKNAMFPGILYITKNKNLFGYLHFSGRLGMTESKMLSNGNLLENGNDQICIRNGQAKIIKKLNGIPYILQHGVLAKVTENKWSVYDNDLNFIDNIGGIGLNQPVYFKNFIIALNPENFIIYELLHNPYSLVKVFEIKHDIPLNCSNEDVCDQIQTGIKGKNKSTFRNINSLTATDKYFFVGTSDGNIIKITKKGRIANIVKFKYQIYKLKITKTNKMIITYKRSTFNDIITGHYIMDIP